MSLRIWWKKGETLWITMVVISSLSDGLIVWWCFKPTTLCCMTDWVRGSDVFAHGIIFLVSSYPSTHHFGSKNCLLCGRGYTGSKLSNNIECEIFQVLLEEAKESYPEDIVVALKSDTVDDITRNVASLTDWVRSWQPKAWSQWLMALKGGIGSSSVRMFPSEWFLLEPDSWFFVFIFPSFQPLCFNMEVSEDISINLSTYHHVICTRW